MITYLKKYNDLSDDVKAGVSTPEITVAIEDLEKEYEVTLATVVMRVLVKDISLVDLPKFFVFEYDMNPRKAEKLVEIMQARIFKNVGAYLGISVDPVMKEVKAIKKESVEMYHGASLSAKKSTPIRSSNFFFSSEDEEEVKELTKKLKIEEVETEATKQESEKEIKLKLDTIIDQTKLDFSSEELHQRFRKIILTYMKGVRNKIDTKQTMLKKVDSGGLGLNDMLAIKALKIADKIKESKNIKGISSMKSLDNHEIDLGKINASKIDKENQKKIESIEPLVNFNNKGGLEDIKKDNIKTQHVTSLGDVPYDFKELQNKKLEEIKKVNWQEINQRSNAETSYGASLSAKKPKLNAVEEKKLSIDLTAKKEASKKEEKVEIKQAPIVMKRPQVSTRPQMTDVKKVPKLSGPVDELKDLDLLNFRRLSNDPAKAITKIKEKLKFLEEDSYEKRLQGIKAWRVSAVNKAYLSIGQISITKNKEVRSIIEEQKKNNKNSLSYGEFLAIMDLNRSIRF